MRIKNYFQFICVALTMAFAVTSCGDDDPITPTPDPDPDPKPTVVYNGFGCSVSVDSIAGDVKTFNTIFLDSMKFYCPELKETEAGVYSASIVYEKGDTVAYKKLLESFRAFRVSVENWIKTAKTPVVSSSNIRFSSVSQSGVSSDWSFNHSSSSSSISNTYYVLIPALRSVTWATDDKKDTGVESVKFNSWMPSKNVKAMFSGDVVINDTDTYSASRQGNVLIAFDENMQIKYGFVIDPSGESFNLIRIGSDQLAKEAITTYTFKE